MAAFKMIFQAVLFVLLVGEVTQALVFGSAPPVSSGQQRRAISALKADIRRYGINRSLPQEVANYTDETLIDTLWRENHDLVQKFLTNDFLKFQAESTTEDTLASYQYYAIQNYYYLVDYVQYKALRMTTFPETSPTQLLSLFEHQTLSMQNDMDYAWSARNNTLATDLKVPLDIVDAGKRSTAQLAYSDWLQKNLDLGWFTLHVMSIPCIYGWFKLAEYLDHSNSTRKDTVFYKTLVEPNLDQIYARELSEFLEANKESYYSPNANQTWTSVFRQAMQLEIDMFSSALGKSLEELV